MQHGSKGGASEVRARSNVSACMSSPHCSGSYAVGSSTGSPHSLSPHAFSADGRTAKHGVLVSSKWKRFLVITIPVLIFILLVSALLVSKKGQPTQLDGSTVIPCGEPGVVPVISDVYVIHSYWSKERRHIAPSLCAWFKSHGGQLADVPCTLFPGFWATAATRDQILDLVARRIVAPLTHAKPQGLLTRILYQLGFSSAAPLFDNQEEVINPSYLGTAASHLLAVQNWTLELVKKGVPPAERTKRHLLLFEDDAVVTETSLTELQGVLKELDNCYDIVGLDSTDNFCALSSVSSTVLNALRLGTSRPKPKLVPARLSYSRNTGLVYSYKGAMNLLSGLPVTREIDLWFRDMMTDGVVKIYVPCPRVITTIGLETVK